MKYVESANTTSQIILMVETLTNGIVQMRIQIITLIIQIMMIAVRIGKGGKR